MTDSTPNSAKANAALQAAIDASRRGDMKSAIAIAERGFAAGLIPQAPYHAFVGMILARCGERAPAVLHLKTAHSLNRQDVTIACNLISVLIDENRDAEALEIATEALARADQSLRVARYRGFVAQKLGRFEEAVAAYNLVLARSPNDFEVLNNIGNAKAGLGDHAGAVECLTRAAALNRRVAPTQLNLASALVALERNAEAEAILLAATEEFPTDPHPPEQLYILSKTLQKQAQAVDAIEKAAARAPNDASLQLRLAIEYGLERRTADAEQAYRRVIELSPGETNAYLGLAIQYEHTNRDDQFAALINEARRNGVSDGAVAFIEALELRRLGQFQEALKRLDAVSPEIEPIRTMHVRATLLDRLERADEAFDAFDATNRQMAESSTEPLKRAAQLRDELAAEVARLTPAWTSGLQPIEIADGRADPTFLVGFPRSGTTLLDTILMGHPDAVVMEEQPPLNLVEQELGGSSCLPDLDQARIAAARQRYFEEVEKVQPLPPGKLLIDKSPLFLYRAPLIHRLFPRARIILALRHPCDVVLSCFMANFRLNSAMANFLRLEDAAEFYDLCFSHWRKSRELLPLNVYSIVYEELVENVSAVVRPLLDWLDLAPNEDMLDHRRTARSRGLITTASYSQVTEPIYKRAAGRWRRYRRRLEPVIDRLSTWALFHGYDDPRLE